VLFDAVLENKANLPTAVLLLPVIFVYKEAEPKAVLKFPVVLNLKD
jgi:hypothetical protein